MFNGQNYVAGEFKDGAGSRFLDINPANEMEIGNFPNSEAFEVAEAVDAARGAFHSWRKLSRVKRAEYFDVLAGLLKDNHDKIVKTISLETGKNLNESHAEALESLHMCQVVAGSGRTSCGEVFASEISDKDVQVIRKPKGVVGIISPWNFPQAIGSFWTSAPAIVEGNCVVHKPSEYTPMVAQVVAELYHQAGFPPGVYNLIHGADQTGKALVEDHVDCILFTGSAEVGRQIRSHCATTWNKSCSCEMGSKSAVIVCQDANMPIALDACAASAFKLSGQRCVSAGRLLVHRSRLEEFKKGFIERVEALTTGDPFDTPAAYYGPLISADAVAKVSTYNGMVEDDKDAKILLQGRKVLCPGFYMRPCVYEVEWKDARYLKEEVFGPHLAIIPFDTVQDAIDIFNDTEYGLALGVITDDFRTMRQMREECDVGMIYFNGGSIAAESHIPFCGTKKSASGWPSASGTYEAVTHKMAVTTNYAKGISFPQGMK
jgi:aldehyde dehydrogenase (NAD+)